MSVFVRTRSKSSKRKHEEDDDSTGEGNKPTAEEVSSGGEILIHTGTGRITTSGTTVHVIVSPSHHS
jgi:hypothetical protein